MLGPHRSRNAHERERKFDCQRSAPGQRVGNILSPAAPPGASVTEATVQLEPTTPVAAPPQSQPWPSPQRAWYGVTLFGLTVMTLFGSAALVGLLMQSIKQDLSLTDTEVSLVVGFAAAAF